MKKFHLKHTLHLETLIKFLFLCSIFVGYFFYLSIKFDFATGGLISAMTWSFFVLCTPVADAGFLLDFPIRLVLGIRMIVTEVLVWCIAILINVCGVFMFEDMYQHTLIGKVFYHILMNPYPYWGLIILCAVGTFLSIYLGDEVMDVIAHKDRKKFHQHGFKYKVLLFIALFIGIFWCYKIVIEELGLVNVL